MRITMQYLLSRDYMYIEKHIYVKLSLIIIIEYF